MIYNFNKKLLIGVPILMVVAFAITFSLFHFFAPKGDTVPTKTASKPSEIIKNIKEPGSVSQLLNLYDVEKETSTGFTTISYTKEGSYTTYAPAPDAIQFSQKDASTSTNSTVVIDSIEVFLNINGLTKMPAATENSLFTIFDSEQTTCQLIQLPASGDEASVVALSCIEKSTIVNQYSTIDKRLQMYKDQKRSPVNPTAIRISSLTENDKTLTSLNVYNVDGSAITLLFAAIGEDWEYIGNQALSAEAGDGKATVDTSFSTELESNVNDPKYEGFLKKHVQ